MFEKAGTLAVEGPVAPLGAMAADDDAGQSASRPGKQPPAKGGAQALTSVRSTSFCTSCPDYTIPTEQ